MHSKNKALGRNGHDNRIVYILASASISSFCIQAGIEVSIFSNCREKWKLVETGGRAGAKKSVSFAFNPLFALFILFLT